MNRKRNLGRRRATASSKQSDFVVVAPVVKSSTSEDSDNIVDQQKDSYLNLDSTLSENDADVPSSSSNVLDSRKVKSSEKAASDRKPFKEITEKDLCGSESKKLDSSTAVSDESFDDIDLNAPPSKRQSLMPLTPKNLGEFVREIYPTTPRTPSSFRRYTEELHRRSSSCVREPPSMLNTMEMGSPKKVWSLLIAKDEIMTRAWKFEDHPEIQAPMRTMIVDWLMDVCYDRKLHRETFHLAVDFLDRFMLQSKSVSCTHLQACATAALCIACKMEEIYPPKICELVEFTDGGCDIQTCINLEQVMLIKLDWNFSSVTAIAWLKLYLQLLSKMNNAEPEAIRRRSAPLRLVRNSGSFSFDDSAVTNHSVGSSPLFSIDGHNTSLDVSLTDSGYTSEFNTSYSEGHIVVQQPDNVPKLMREEFVQLARVLDLIVMDHHFLKYRHGVVAAAVMFCAYEPVSCIEQITGIKKDEIHELIEIVQVFMDHCMKTNHVMEGMMTQLDVSVEDRHNIQVYRKGFEDDLKAIHATRQRKRVELLQLHKAAKSTDMNKTTPKPFRMA